MQFASDEGENERVFRLRGVTFGMVIEVIAEKGSSAELRSSESREVFQTESAGSGREWVRLLCSICDPRGHLDSQDGLSESPIQIPN
jgi:hypothetical protein